MVHPKDTRITIASFFSGYEGLGIGVKQALSGNARVIVACEIEAYAIANLIAKMEDGKLDACPVYTDMRNFPYRKFRGLVDIACGGVPCQPHSVAGKRRGGSDERFLFDAFLDGLSEMQPGQIFIENVEGLLTSKMPDGSLCFRHIIERLEAMDYRVEAGLFTAAEVGAPHRRKRVFILADSGNTRPRSDSRTIGCEGRRTLVRQENWAERSIRIDATSPSLAESKSRMSREPAERERREGTCRGSEEVLANSTKQRLEGTTGAILQKQADGLTREGQLSGVELANPNQFRPQRERPDSNPSGRERQDERPAGLCNGTRWPARPGEPQHEWEPPRVTQPGLGGDASRHSLRVDRLRLLGNGVVPAQAARAYTVLKQRLDI